MENYISIQKEYSISFKQLLVKEIFVNGPSRLDFTKLQLKVDDYVRKKLINRP